MIRYAERDTVAARRRRKRDRRRAVLHRVLDQVPQRPLEQRLVRHDRERRSVLDDDRRARDERIVRRAAGNLSEHRAHVDARDVRRQPGHVEARGRQHVLDQTVQLGEIALDLVQARVRRRVARQQLEGHPHARQR